MSHTSKMSGIPLKSRTLLEAAVESLKALPGLETLKLTEGLAPRLYNDYNRGGAEVQRGYQFHKDAQRILDRQEPVALEDVLCLEMPGKYDVGFCWNRQTGEYEPLTDTYQNQIGKYLGAADKNLKRGGITATTADMGLFYQHYANAATREWVADQGYTVYGETVDQETGAIHLEVGTSY